jgi:hypothetical protein
MKHTMKKLLFLALFGLSIFTSCKQKSVVSGAEAYLKIQLNDPASYERESVIVDTITNEQLEKIHLAQEYLFWFNEGEKIDAKIDAILDYYIPGISDESKLQEAEDLNDKLSEFGKKLDSIKSLSAKVPHSDTPAIYLCTFTFRANNATGGKIKEVSTVQCFLGKENENDPFSMSEYSREVLLEMSKFGK